MNTKLLARYIVRETLGVIIMAVALFWSAGETAWWPAWAATGLTLGWVIATAWVILSSNPDLLAERLGPRKGAKSWDTVLLGILGLSQLARYIVAGFDHRFGWTGGFPLAVQLIGLALGILGYSMIVWATAANAFFSQVVRIQSERGQTVVSQGPYRAVRHPAYLGASLYELAVAFLLASWGALALGALNVLLLVIRTFLEDRTLQAELPGYQEYARRVRYRIFPGVW
ncbi:MAG: isoprenylcysteine carboxylmethyltransferase family protein [Anaerolineae bacterium]|nr:isoprenylcysteine carboxylmethyltransferase family protein [Anaerolineae bacterium]